MENENQNPIESQVTEKKSHMARNLLIAFAIVLVGVAGYFGYKNPELFKAELTGGTEGGPAGNYTLYIPNDYVADESDSGEVEVKAGVVMNDIQNLRIWFDYLNAKINITGIRIDASDKLYNIPITSVSSAGSEPFYVRFDHDDLQGGFISATPGDTLFRLEFELVPGFDQGPAGIGGTFYSTSNCPATKTLGPAHDSDYAACIFDDADDLIDPLTFRDGRITISGGSSEPGDDFDVCEELGDCSGHGYCDGQQCICDVGFAGPRCASCDIANQYTGYPECKIDLFADLVSILLEIEGPLSSVTLHPTDDLGLIMTPTFDPVPVSPAVAPELTFQDVTFVAQPATVLSDAALAGGRLVKGDSSGTTTLLVEIEKADGTVIRSNIVTVTVPSGPIIEYANILGADSIVRGGRIELSTKISDVNQIQNVADIRTFIEGSGGSPQFTATPFIQEVEITNSGSEDVGGADDADPITEYFRIYKIPVEIPTDLQMVDGDYDLRMEITDIQGNTASTTLPIYIGDVASGDINQDGDVTLADVFLALQFSNGSRQPTNDEEAEANMDGSGGITMFDVILVFNRCKDLGKSALNPDGVCN